MKDVLETDRNAMVTRYRRFKTARLSGFKSVRSRPHKSVSRLQSNSCTEGQMSTVSINRPLKPAQRLAEQIKILQINKCNSKL